MSSMSKNHPPNSKTAVTTTVAHNSPSLIEQNSASHQEEMHCFKLILIKMTGSSRWFGARVVVKNVKLLERSMSSEAQEG